MIKQSGFYTVLFALAIVFALMGFKGIAEAKPVNVVVYVTSQGLFYDSIVAPNSLPQKGPFQQLFPPGTNPDCPDCETLSTEFGPRDPGYVGGRWWVDANGSGEMDEGDAFFPCPLLGPGRETP
jgi:hypothetical protein